MRHRQQRAAEDRGAVLVHVAIALLGLTAFTTFVVDYGVFWESRRQAQNAADGAALAGATALAFEDPTDATGVATEAALAVSQRNIVWGQPPIVDPSTDIQVRTPSAGGACPSPNVDGTCIRVDVYRTAGRGNPLPVFFGSLVGLTQQDVQATATAQVLPANATTCLKPWAVIDRWEENHPGGGFNLSSRFDKYHPVTGARDLSITPPDDYAPPSTGSTGTGFYLLEPDGTFSADYGLQLHLNWDPARQFNFNVGWFAPLNLGSGSYLDSIIGCVGTTYEIGDDVPVGPSVSDTQAGVDALVAQDSSAFWNPGLHGGRGGVAGSAFPLSPRIVAVPLVSPDLMREVNLDLRETIPIANIAAMFIEGYDSATDSIVVWLMTMPGLRSGASPIGEDSAFLRTAVLVR